MRSRGVAVVLVLAHGGLLFQGEVLGLAGGAGVCPCARDVRAVIRDFSPRVRWLYFPSLLYLVGAADVVLVALVRTGLVLAAFAAVAPAWFRYTRAACFVGSGMLLASLGICSSVSLVYPWDCMLLEAVWLSALRVATDGAGWVDFLDRWLLARVLGGFAKFRFFGSPPLFSEAVVEDLRTVLFGAPLVHRAGVWASVSLPSVLIHGAYAFYFLVELVAPAGYFGPKHLRQASLVASSALMLGISVTASFGWFNFLFVVLCLPAATGAKAQAGRALVPLRRALVAFYVVVSTLLFIPCEYASPGCLYWEPAARLANTACGGPLVAVLRIVSGWRLAHSYGVFPPEIRGYSPVLPLYEVQAQDGGWTRLSYRFQGRDPPPLYLGPLFFRFDFGSAYSQRKVAGVKGSIAPEVWHFPTKTAYMRGAEFWEESVAYGLLRGSAEVYALFGAPPVLNASAVRIRYTQYDRAIAGAALAKDYWETQTLDAPMFTRDALLVDLPNPDEAAWALHARGLLDLAMPRMPPSRSSLSWSSDAFADLAKAVSSCAEAAPLDERATAPLIWELTSAAGIEDYDLIDLLRFQVEALLGTCEADTCAAEGHRSARTSASIRVALSQPSVQRARTLDGCAGALRAFWDPRAARAAQRYLPQQEERFSLFGVAACLPCVAALHLLPPWFGPDACRVLQTEAYADANAAASPHPWWKAVTRLALQRERSLIAQAAHM